MGRKAKKFIDKKRSATFQLLSRDSRDPSFAADAPGGDRVFVRVDNNPFSVETFGDECGDEDPDSIFADAPDDVERSEGAGGFGSLVGTSTAKKQQLPEHVRREILELGFPDDGYNYLLHLREIRNTGGGSAFYQNPKTRLDLVPKDVKAYDASRVLVPGLSDEHDDGSMCNVASHSVNLRVQKVFDPEVAALLDDSDVSRLGSDVEDLEEDFVVQANYPDPVENVVERKLNLLRICETAEGVADLPDAFVHQENQTTGNYEYRSTEYASEKPRARRLLDEQFDLLERQEYGSDYEDDYDCYGSFGGAEEDECIAEKLKHSLNEKVMDEVEIEGGYKAPADLLHETDLLKSKELEDSAADLIHRCREYAEKYEEDNEEDKEVMIVEESTDESEVWDCETIVSTYSNLDNHPRKIEAPEIARRRLLSGTVSGALATKSQVISLRGKERLPVDFLPRGRNPATDKAKGGSTLKPEQQKRKQHGQESKEEKKERKSSVKEERREARRLKKEMKGLYRCEAHRAQKVAAITGPSSIPLM